MASVSVSQTRVEIKFDLSLSFSSIQNSAFTLRPKLLNPDGTPTLDANGRPTYGEPIPNPFKPIMKEHYNSISRTLQLFFSEPLPEAGDYRLRIEGLKDSSGRNLNPANFDFNYHYTAPGGGGGGGGGPVYDDNTPIHIEDKSILKAPFDSSGTITAANPNFYIKRTDPKRGEIYIEDDHNDGRVTVTFSANVDEGSLEGNYKIQQKPMGVLSRWETLEVDVEVDGERVHFALPEQFGTGFKYRVRLLSDIRSTDEHELLDDVEFLFATDAVPVFVDPEEFLPLYGEEASMVEILEFIHRYSTEVHHYFGDDPPFIAYEYIRAAVLCSLGKIYGYGLDGDASSLALGDLKIASQAYPRNKITRANAANWCELAAVLRDEMLRGASGMKAVVKGTKYRNPMPKRHIKSPYGGNGRRL